MFLHVFSKSEKTCFYVFDLLINVFNIYAKMVKNDMPLPDKSGSKMRQTAIVPA